LMFSPDTAKKMIFKLGPLTISNIFKIDDISYKTILLVVSIQTKRETISSHCTHCHFLLLNKTSMIFDNTCRSLDFLSSQTEK
jgi:hypothetical protein